MRKEMLNRKVNEEFIKLEIVVGILKFKRDYFRKSTVNI